MKKNLEPREGTMAFDYGQQPVIIRAIGKVGEESQDEVMQYDNGIMADELPDCPKGTVLVAATLFDDERDTAVWVWGYEGVCYENGPSEFNPKVLQKTQIQF